MATKDNKLVLVFKDNQNKEVQFSFAYVDPEVATQSVKTLMSTMIASTAIFSVTLVSPVSATIKVTTSTILDIAS